jgi:hypothetical protein
MMTVRAVFAGQGLSLFWQITQMAQRALRQVMIQLHKTHIP